MKQLLKIFNLLMCLEFILGPVAPQMSFLGQRAQAETTCPAGLYMDTNTNTCKINAEASNILNATNRCANGDKNCYENNAKDGLNKNISDGKAPELQENPEALTTTITSIATAAPLVFAIVGMRNAKNTKGCRSLSMYTLMAGSLAFIVGDNLANWQYRGALKDIKEEWGKIVNPVDAAGDKDKEREASVKAQSESFEMLAKAEDAFEESASTKEKLYYAASAAYGVAAGIAIAEMIKAKKLNAESIKASTEHGKASTKLSLAQIKMSMSGLTPAMALKNAADLKVAMAEEKIAAAKKQAALLAEGKHKTEQTCADMTASINHKQESLYSTFAKPKSFDFGRYFQALHGLEKSQDLISFMMNLKVVNGEEISPIQDYEYFQTAFQDINTQDTSLLALLKKASIAVIHQMNPIPKAFAVDNLDSLPGDNENNSGSGSSSSTTTKPTTSKTVVDTNAAKSFRAAKDYEPRGLDWLGLGVGAGIGVIAGATIGKKITNSTARLAFSTVMSGMSAYMGSYAGKQAKASNLRAAKLREMKQGFVSASVAINSCKSEDRNDPSKPNCYCYTADNKRNPNRGSSTICQNMWAGVNFKPGTYSTNPATVKKTCINAQGASDATCTCKSSNTCLKVNLSSVKGLGTNTLSMLSKGIDPLNKLADGTASSADLDATSMANLAARTSKLVDEMAKDKTIADLVKDKDKAALELTKELQAASGSLAKSLPSTHGSSFSMPTNAGDAASMLNKDIEKSEEEPRALGGGETIAGPNGGGSNEALDFGLNQDELNAADQGQLAEVMKEDFDYGSNDVNEGANGSLFEVISNRYQRSAMKRLFDEGAPSKTDQPPKK